MSSNDHIIDAIFIDKQHYNTCLRIINILFAVSTSVLILCISILYFVEWDFWSWENIWGG